jgi:Icc-related predicted phosphoesterase
MKITFISDTHSKHNELDLPGGDILVHCGDFSRSGSLQDVDEFAEFISKTNYKHKIVIAGNHDWCFEDHCRVMAETILSYHNIHYLNDSGVEIEGLKFWGSPVSPWFNNWAFNRGRGEEIKAHWDLIPSYTDILITHGPPYEVLDQCDHGELVGCVDLYETVMNLQPKIHAFGHVHEGYGIREVNGIKFVNASNLDERYECVNAPIEIII